MTKGERTFQANTEALFEELSSAFEWDHPCIIIVISNDFWVKTRAMDALKNKLVSEDGFKVISLNFASHSDEELVRSLKTLPQGKSIYFATNIIGSNSKGKDTFSYRALNMQRETFIEDKIKIVFWLSEQEAALLPVHAPDFWAFRHRVIIFFDSKPTLNLSMAGSMFLWHADVVELSTEQIKNQVTDLLIALEHESSKNSIEQKTKILSELSKYYWMLGDRHKSQAYSEQGLLLNNSQLANRDLVNLWISKAADQLCNKKFTESQTIIEKIKSVFSDDPLIAMNLALILVFSSRKKEGISMARGIAERFDNNPQLSGQLGYLLYLSGMLDEASKYFEIASEQTGLSKFKIGKAICEIKLNRVRNHDVQGEQENLIHKASIALAKHEEATALDLLSTEIHSHRETIDSLLSNYPNLWIASYPKNLELILRRLSS